MGNGLTIVASCSFRAVRPQSYVTNLDRIEPTSLVLRERELCPLVMYIRQAINAVGLINHLIYPEKLPPAFVIAIDTLDSMAVVFFCFRRF